MALARYEVTVTDEHGNIVSDAQVEVRREVPGQPLAVLYSDRDGLIPLGNPFSVDPDTAVAAFHVAGGAYRVRAFKTGFERIERYKGIGTAAETDAGLLAVAVPPTWLFASATADADPGDGNFRLNNATASSATAAYIDNLTFGGTTVTGWLDTFDDSGNATTRGFLTIFDPTAPATIFRIYAVSGSVVDGTGYRKLTISHLAGSGSFTAGMQYQIEFSQRGPVGPLADVVDDTTPQLGGDLDANGRNIGFDNNTGVTDDAGNEQIVFHKTASAVNQVGITNAATGTAPTIAVEGGDTNIDLALAGKGTGAVAVRAGYVPQATLTDAATVTWDGSTQQVATLPIGGNRVLGDISNPKAGATYLLRVVQDSTGSRTLDLSKAIYKWPNSTTPVLSTAPGAVDVLSFLFDGVSMLGSIMKDFTNLFPNIEATNTGTSGATTSFAVPLPASIVAGELLLVMVSLQNATGATVVNTPSGWTQLYSTVGGGNLRRAACFWKIASGGEGSTVTITSDVSSSWATNSYRISRAFSGAPFAGTTATGSSANPDPPSNTPSAGSRKYLWLAVEHDIAASGTAPTLPTNYTTSVRAQQGTTVQTTSGRRNLEAASDDPATWTIGASAQWAAQTVAVRPA